MTQNTHNSSRRRFVRTTTGGMILAAVPLAGCSAFSGIPAAATAAWQPTEPANDPRRWALSYAILAPNPHNRQPWLIDLSRSGEISVRIDTTRLLPHTDPFSRQILIGTGAMLGTLELAAASIGYRSEIHLFESAEYGRELDGRPMARIRLVKADSPQTRGENPALFAEVLRRRTVREQFDVARDPDNRFTGALQADLLDEAARRGTSRDALATGVISRHSDATRFEAIGRLAKAAWKIELTTPRTVMESVELLRVGPAEIDRHRDGITISDPKMALLDTFGLLDRTKPPTPESSITKAQLDKFDAQIDSTPAYYWLTSAGNTRKDQVLAGMTYARAQLSASAHGLVMHPISQALQEYEEMSEARRELNVNFGASRPAPGAPGEGKTLQMLCRLGYLPSGIPMPGPAPRRGLAANLVG